MAKREHFVGKADEFKDGDRRIVFVGDTEIGLFKNQGEFYAYSNTCLHRESAGVVLQCMCLLALGQKTSSGATAA
jgi:nitrite reductase/ring-hydroxylating ferredoxin subunit